MSKKPQKASNPSQRSNGRATKQQQERLEKGEHEQQHEQQQQQILQQDCAIESTDEPGARESSSLCLQTNANESGKMSEEMGEPVRDRKRLKCAQVAPPSCGQRKDKVSVIVKGGERVAPNSEMTNARLEHTQRRQLKLSLRQKRAHLPSGERHHSVASNKRNQSGENRPAVVHHQPKVNAQPAPAPASSSSPAAASAAAPAPAPAPASALTPTPAVQNVCAACAKPIRERYLLMAVDKHWHEDCLKCDCCDCRLGEVGSSLFMHSDKLLCRRDFLRIFGQHGHCAACKRSIPPYEMVMRANELAYHMDCFACQQCKYRFCVGDRYHLTSTHKIICLVCHSERDLAHRAADNEQDERVDKYLSEKELELEHQPHPLTQSSQNLNLSTSDQTKTTATATKLSHSITSADEHTNQNDHPEREQTSRVPECGVNSTTTTTTTTTTISIDDGQLGYVSPPGRANETAPGCELDSETSRCAPEGQHEQQFVELVTSQQQQRRQHADEQHEAELPPALLPQLAHKKQNVGAASAYSLAAPTTNGGTHQEQACVM